MDPIANTEVTKKVKWKSKGNGFSPLMLQANIMVPMKGPTPCGRNGEGENEMYGVAKSRNGFDSLDNTIAVLQDICNKQ